MDNLTAKVSLFARAYHHKHNDVKIFDDYMAEQLLGEDYEIISQNMINGINFFLPGFQGTKEDGLKLIVNSQLSPSVLGRSIFCETALQNEIHIGCEQYVIFGAGYDTFSLRNKNSELSVFEVDLAEVIDDKMNRLKKYQLESNSIFVPCDLSKENWNESLLKKGFDKNTKSFASLLGLVYYLEKDDFKKLLLKYNEIITPGSAICFDYPMTDGSKETETNKALARGAGEEMKASYTYAELEILLQECGFLIYEHLSANEMDKQFFEKYNSQNESKINSPIGVGYILAVKG